MGTVLANFSLRLAPKGQLTLGRQTVLFPRSYLCQGRHRGKRADHSVQHRVVAPMHTRGW